MVSADHALTAWEVADTIGLAGAVESIEKRSEKSSFSSAFPSWSPSNRTRMLDRSVPHANKA
jgi:hypothetical protein